MRHRFLEKCESNRTCFFLGLSGRKTDRKRARRGESRGKRLGSAAPADNYTNFCTFGPSKTAGREKRKERRGT